MEPCGLCKKSGLLQDANDRLYRSEIDGAESFAYDIRKGHQEGKKMSLVCTLVNESGIVMCADSRSTRVEAGTMVSDKKRGGVKKIFRSEKFLMATWGLNLYHNGEIWCPLEHLIVPILDGYSGEFEDFIPLLYKRLDASFRADIGTEYFFLFGFRVRGSQYATMDCRMNAKNYFFSRIQFGPEIRFAGNTDMVPVQNLVIHHDWETKEMQAAGELILDQAIRLGDVFLHYNPVGGAIQTEIFV